MKKELSRREFIKVGAIAGMGLAAVGPLKGAAAETPGPVDLSIVHGDDYYRAAITAVEQLGGIGRFAPKGARVAILANPQRPNPGAFTSPQVLKAALNLCKQAGAAEIACISWQPEQNWEQTGLKKVVDEADAKLLITDLKNEALFKAVPVPRGVSLKEARIMQSYYDYDVFINIPVCKDHAGNKFTGTMKNLMGLNSPKCNWEQFHKPGWKTDPADIRHLDQCIADLNTVIPDHLCIVDATEFIITNGPFGPGKLHKADIVVAGVNRVALDAYCCALWGLDPNDIHVLSMAAGLGLGTMDWRKLNVRESGKAT